MSNYPLEPFIYKTIKPIPFLSKEERVNALRDADFNLFRIPARKVTIDLLTDSGTGAMSEKQWACLMEGDESYASATSYERFEKSVKEFTGMRYVIPVHQGRAAEKIIAEAFLNSGDIVIANTLFDTTRANFEHRGAQCIDIPSRKAKDPARAVPFKGDADLGILETLLKKHGKKIKLVVMTLTNNSGGGQPASFKNISEVSRLAKEHRVPFLIDSCRIAENSYFIWRDELGRKTSIAEIVKKTYALCDLSHMSAKKDGLANMGGLIVTNKKQFAEKMGFFTILYEGYLTYGGMSGRDLETIAQGLKEVVDENYLTHRVGQVAYLHQGLSESGIPLIDPPGGHAVYVDAAAFLPHIPKEQFPGQALAVALYAEGGIRTVEIGSLMFGEHAQQELVRLALPRRVYTKSHLDYVIETMAKLMKEKDRLRGLAITWEPPALRHFSCKLKPL